MGPYHYFARNNFTPFIIQFRERRYLGLYRKALWQVMNRDGSFGVFVSRWFLGHLQWYHGTAKCDGSQSIMAGRIVMTDEPKELLAFRWRTSGPSGPPVWDNMGGT